MPSNEETRLIRTCQRMIGTEIVRVSHPGGRSRDSRLLELADGRTAYVTRRPSVKLATLEARVLKRLSERGAPVPKVLGFNGMILVQQDMGSRRVSQALADASPETAAAILRAGLDALAAVHAAGSDAGLDDDVPSIGRDEGWFDGLLSQPAVISDALRIPAPRIDRDAMRERLRPRTFRLIKWDARPGNAIWADDGTAVWIDWEHCGRRNRLDDMVWFLADESTPDLPDHEAALIEDHLPRFADAFDLDEARAYLATLGCLHMSVRLQLILENKDGKEWWDPDYVLERDKVGVTPQGVERLCARGARWAARDPLTTPFVSWFESARDTILAPAEG